MVFITTKKKSHALTTLSVLIQRRKIAFMHSTLLGDSPVGGLLRATTCDFPLIYRKVFLTQAEKVLSVQRNEKTC